MGIYVVFQIWSRGSDIEEDELQNGITAISAFQARTAEEACQAAAAATGKLANYVAVEGALWGIDMVAVDDAQELPAKRQRRQAATAELEPGN